uniref:Transmembrane protein n=1 Tax=Meloidogyne hapla TaxID=6305 RepID=A0A1I8BZZ9_MELHA
MQKGAILPDEERRYFSDLNKNVQDNEEFQTLNVVENETNQKQHLEQKQILCYKINLQEELIKNLENHKFGQASPLVNLANRSVATIAVGFAHLLLLFSQVYLLNCLEVDNLEQRRGKLIFAGILLILGIIEGLHIYWKMRKCTKKIDIEREKKAKRLNVKK